MDWSELIAETVELLDEVIIDAVEGRDINDALEDLFWGVEEN